MTTEPLAPSTKQSDSASSSSASSSSSSSTVANPFARELLCCVHCKQMNSYPSGAVMISCRRCQLWLKLGDVTRIYYHCAGCTRWLAFPIEYCGFQCPNCSRVSGIPHWADEEHDDDSPEELATPMAVYVIEQKYLPRHPIEDAIGLYKEKPKTFTEVYAKELETEEGRIAIGFDPPKNAGGESLSAKLVKMYGQQQADHQPNR